MPTETWLIFIFIFMILGSVTALEIKDILSSIIAIGVVGLGVSVSFLFMEAPDLAIVQFLFEIFAMIILLRAFIRKDYHLESPSKIGALYSVITVVVLLAVFIFSVSVFKALPPFGEPLMQTAQHYVESGAKETGAANLVASVILDYRAYDTLGEITVLFTAILGSLTLLRIHKQRKKEGESES